MAILSNSEQPAGWRNTLAVRTATFQFQPVDRDLLWDNLLLHLSQVAELTGLDRRRLSYWVAKGYLQPATREPDRFDGRALEKAWLLRQALAAGIPLRRALRLYEQFSAQQAARRKSGAGAASTELARLRYQLAGARQALADAMETLERLEAMPPPGTATEEQELLAVGR